MASGRQLSVSQAISGSGRGADAVLRDTRPRLEGLFAAAAAKDVGGTAALPGGNGGEDGEGDETGGAPCRSCSVAKRRTPRRFRV